MTWHGIRVVIPHVLPEIAGLAPAAVLSQLELCLAMLTAHCSTFRSGRGR